MRMISAPLYPTGSAVAPMASDCDQEMCPMWDGDSCPCERFGLDRSDLSLSGTYTVEVSDGE